MTLFYRNFECSLANSLDLGAQEHFLFSQLWPIKGELTGGLET